jgi:LPXTG-site transpeptidase (sortase) family protein
MPTSVPIQIWPDPAQAKNIKPKKIRQKSLSFSFKINLAFFHGVFQRLYKYIIILLLIAAISSIGYFVYARFIRQESTSVGVPLVPVDQIYSSLINSNFSYNLPVRLRIPVIKVDAAIQPVGLTSAGALDVPNNITDVGWYKFGPNPGQKGSAVIDGHFDSPNGLPAVFSRLDTLKVGDSIIVEDDKSILHYFVVKKLTNYLSEDFVSDIFNMNDGSHLNLITCNGIWDVNKKTYTERLVVFAEAVQP